MNKAIAMVSAFLVFIVGVLFLVQADAIFSPMLDQFKDSQSGEVDDTFFYYVTLIGIIIMYFSVIIGIPFMLITQSNHVRPPI